MRHSKEPVANKMPSRTETPLRPEVLAVPMPGESLLTLKAIDVERVATDPWSPSLTYLPTLGDHGESIEQFRSLRSRVYEFHLQNPLKTIVVSSGMPGEGKTFVAANLAISLARNKNQHVLLIDGDLRRPSLHGILGASAAPGLSDYLTGAAELAEIIQRNEPAVAEAGEGSRAFPNCPSSRPAKTATHRRNSSPATGSKK